MADEECVLIDEKLAVAVREFPVLYDKSLKDFKDRNKKDLAWNVWGAISAKIIVLLLLGTMFYY